MVRSDYCVCLFVIFSIFNNYAQALSSQCYACHGEYCNDPFDKDKATVMTCSNSDINGRDTGVSKNFGKIDKKFEEWNSLETKLWNAFRDLFGTTEYVCAKSSYYNNIHQINMTIRRCMPKNFKGMEPCTYLSNIINNGYGKVRTCSFCESDLCNSGRNLRNSVLILFVFIVLKKIF